jgi:hypothetical protein
MLKRNSKGRWETQDPHLNVGDTITVPEDGGSGTPPTVADPAPPPNPYMGTDPAGLGGGGAPVSDGPMPYPDEGSEGGAELF